MPDVVIVIAGMPGSGKSTAACAIAELGEVALVDACALRAHLKASSGNEDDLLDIALEAHLSVHRHVVVDSYASSARSLQQLRALTREARMHTLIIDANNETVSARSGVTDEDELLAMRADLDALEAATREAASSVCHLSGQGEPALLGVQAFNLTRRAGLLPGHVYDRLRATEQERAEQAPGLSPPPARSKKATDRAKAANDEAQRPEPKPNAVRTPAPPVQSETPPPAAPQVVSILDVDPEDYFAFDGPAPRDRRAGKTQKQLRRAKS